MEEGLRIRSVELAVGMHFNECSIAAAEANRNAYKLISDPENREERSLFVASREEVLAVPSEFYVVPLASDVRLEDGRPIDLTLVQRKGEESTLLTANARGNIALPVASFRPREGSLCDYVQIGEEMHDEAFVVTQEDETNRRQLVDLIGKSLDVNPLATIYRDLLAKPGDIIDIAKARELMESIEDTRKYGTIIMPEVRKEQIFQYAILETIASKERLYFNRLHLFSNRCESNQLKAQELLANLATVNLEDINQGKIPGTKSPITQKILLKKALEARGVSADQIHQADRSVRTLANTLDVPEQFDRILGPYNPKLEKVLDFAGRMALSGVPRSVVIEDFRIANNEADTRISIASKPNGSIGSYILSVSALPIAIRDGTEIDAGNYVLNRFRPTTLSEDDIDDISKLIDITGK